MAALSFDPVWETKYASGHAERAPWDEVVSFVFRSAPKGKNRGEIRVLEVGCGTANNLWFFALEGFAVYGIEGSASAIKTAKKRFKQDGIRGDLRVGDFTKLPYAAGQFDIVIDRGALVCTSTTGMKVAIAEIHRVLKVDGKFLFTPYGRNQVGAKSGRKGKDGVTIDIKRGGLANNGQLRFVAESEIEKLLPKARFEIESVNRVDVVELRGEKRGQNLLSHYRVIARKV